MTSEKIQRVGVIGAGQMGAGIAEVCARAHVDVLMYEPSRELAAADRKHPTHVLGFASNMHELMAIADLIITKPGGLTSSEALAMGKPLFILNPIPGQEAANSDFLLERGAAVKVNRVEDLPYRIERLLGTPRLTEMEAAAKALGRPCAAKAICKEVVQRVKAG